jgi:hypothetical protein
VENLDILFPIDLIGLTRLKTYSDGQMSAYCHKHRPWLAIEDDALPLQFVFALLEQFHP